jgi:hypothetical protein
MNFLEAFSWLVQDELDRRRSRLLDRRFTLSGLPERKDLKDFDWTYSPKVPKRDILELATLKFIEAREGALLIGQPGTGKSHCATAKAQLAVQCGYKVFYREAHVLPLQIAAPVPRHVIQRHGAAWARPENIVVNGPYTLDDWQPQSFMRLRANARYWGAKETSGRNGLTSGSTPSAAAHTRHGRLSFTSAFPAGHPIVCRAKSPRDPCVSVVVAEWKYEHGVP